MFRFPLLAVISVLAVSAQTQPERALLVISIDGMRPDYVSAMGSALQGSVVESIKHGGMHGYAPSHPEMLASFLISRAGIAKNDLGEIDMRSIAPTLAAYLGVSFTSDLKPLVLAK